MRSALAVGSGLWLGTAFIGGSVGAGSFPFDAMPSVVTDTTAVRGMRREYFGSLSAIDPCLNLQRAVFGPPGDYGAWLDRVRSSLVRHEGEEEILRVMRRGFSRVDQQESGLLKVARLYSQVMGGGVGSCAELVAPLRCDEGGSSHARDDLRGTASGHGAPGPRFLQRDRA